MKKVISFKNWWYEKPRFEISSKNFHLLIELPSASWVCITILLISFVNWIAYVV